ncbi:MAG: glycosyltransferase family 4 protein [Lentisphaerota bacterium]
MKILLCADDRSANTLAWARGFRALGAEVLIASVRAEKDTDGVLALGNPNIPARLNFLLSTRKLRNILASYKPDILIGYRLTSYGYLCSCTGFHPLVLAAQNEQITYLPKPNMFRKKVLEFFAGRAIRKADLIHAWGENMLPRLGELGADGKKVLVLHRGIDLSLFTAFTRKPEAKNPVFISSRSLFPEYKINRIIGAFSHVLIKIPGAKLKVIGEGPEKTNLHNLGKALGISDNIEFTGKLSPMEVATVLNDSDIYVSIIESEGVSSSLLEACACGVYPIVTDMPASRMLIEDGKSGTLINPESTISELAQTMILTAENTALRESAVKMNIELINDKFDFRKNIASFLTTYRNFATLNFQHAPPNKKIFPERKN